MALFCIRNPAAESGQNRPIAAFVVRHFPGIRLWWLLTRLDDSMYLRFRTHNVTLVLKIRLHTNRCGFNKFDGYTTVVAETGRMPAKEREDEVLCFIHKHGIAFPPKVIYRGLKLEENITFSYRTVHDLLKRLTEQGFAIRCERGALDEGKIKQLPEDATNKRTYYYITDAGRDRIISEE